MYDSTPVCKKKKYLTVMLVVLECLSSGMFQTAAKLNKNSSVPPSFNFFQYRNFFQSKHNAIIPKIRLILRDSSLVNSTDILNHEEIRDSRTLDSSVIKPYTIVLMCYDRPICGGSILTSSLILTAAHCVLYTNDANQYLTRDPRTLTIRAGSLDPTTGGINNKVHSIDTHPKFEVLFDEFTFLLHILNDVAILHLVIDFPMNKFNIFAIKIPSDSAFTNSILENGTQCHLTQWGLTSCNEGDKLEMTDNLIKLMPENTCNDYLGQLAPTRLCSDFSHQSASQIKSEDSGSPLVYEGVQVGLISYGPKCNSNQYPIVFSRIDKFIDFIHNTLSYEMERKFVDVKNYSKKICYKWSSILVFSYLVLNC